MKSFLLLLLPIIFHSSLVQAKNIPIEHFASLPNVSQVKLSPDGNFIASLVRLNDPKKQGTVVSVYDIKNDKNYFPLYTENKEFKINWLRWANNEKILVSARYPTTFRGVPVTETRLLVVDFAKKDVRNVFSKNYLERQEWVPKFQDNIVDILPDDKDHILLAIRTTRQVTSKVVKVNINNQKVKIVEGEEHSIIDWITDKQHRIRMAVSFDETTYSIMYREIGKKVWRPIWEFEAFSEEWVWPLGFDNNSDILYLNAYHEGKKAIFKVDLSTPDKKRELIFSDSKYDVNGSLIYSNITKEVIGITYSDNGGFTFWSDTHQALQRSINQAMPDTSNSLYSFSDDENRYIVLATSDTDPGVYLLGDRKQKSISMHALRYASVDPKVMAEKRLISYKARDGLDIEAYLTLPKGEKKKNLPAIVFPHGGPISYDNGGFDYWTQFFASRGYAVLQMNFRGSDGYGYDFMKSGIKNWGQEMQNDVEDGTRWLLEQNIADKNRICVVGASYGGYAALMESARNSDLYQCAISFAGVTDLKSLVDEHRRFTNYELVKEQIGENTKMLRNNSPLYHSDEIDIPVLLVHGDKDRAVPVLHSRRMHKALKRAGKNVIYIEQEEGDHYLGNEKHRLQLFQAMDDFLQTHLSNDDLAVIGNVAR